MQAQLRCMEDIGWRNTNYKVDAFYYSRYRVLVVRGGGSERQDLEGRQRCKLCFTWEQKPIRSDEEYYTSRQFCATWWTRERRRVANSRDQHQRQGRASRSFHLALKYCESRHWTWLSHLSPCTQRGREAQPTQNIKCLPFPCFTGDTEHTPRSQPLRVPWYSPYHPCHY